MKIYTKKVKKCSDCPYENAAFYDDAFCGLSLKKIRLHAGESIPNWCKLEDTNKNKKS